MEKTPVKYKKCSCCEKVLPIFLMCEGNDEICEKCYKICGNAPINESTKPLSEGAKILQTIEDCKDIILLELGEIIAPDISTGVIGLSQNDRFYIAIYGCSHQKTFAVLAKIFAIVTSAQINSLVNDKVLIAMLLDIKDYIERTQKIDAEDFSKEALYGKIYVTKIIMLYNQLIVMKADLA